MRFLFEWQHLTPDTRSEGRDALAAVLEQLEGFQAAAGAWEEDILPARVKAYANSSLDELCRAGKIVWTRLTERARSAGGTGAQHADRAFAALSGARMERVDGPVETTGVIGPRAERL